MNSGTAIAWLISGRNQTAYRVRRACVCNVNTNATVHRIRDDRRVVDTQQLTSVLHPAHRPSERREHQRTAVPAERFGLRLAQALRRNGVTVFVLGSTVPRPTFGAAWSSSLM